MRRTADLARVPVLPRAVPAEPGVFCRAIITASTATLLWATACSTTITGDPVAATEAATQSTGTTGATGGAPTSSTPAPEVLDTGSFRTTPQPDFGTAGTLEYGKLLEARRLSDYVVVPSEIDPELIANVMPYITFGDADALLGVSEAVATTAGDDLIVGFWTTRTAPDTAEGSGAPNAKTLSVAVLRYPDSDAARQAAQRIYTGLTTAGAGGFALAPDPIDGRPDIAVGAANSIDGSARITGAVASHEAYVLYAEAVTPANGAAWHPSVLTRFVDRQKPLIDTFVGTSPDALVQLPIDDSGVLALTVQGQFPDSGNETAAYGPRGATHLNDRVALLDYLERSGTDRVAFDGSTVYRTADGDGAATLYDLLRRDALDGGSFETTAPPNVPDSSCFSSEGIAGPVSRCLIHRDRYVAEVSGFDGRYEVHQATAAQYLILGAATG